MVSNNLNIPSLQGKNDFKIQENPSMGTAGDASYMTNRVNASKDSNPTAAALNFCPYLILQILRLIIPTQGIINTTKTTPIMLTIP